MIYRVLYDGIDIHTNSVPDVLINPTVETEMNTAGSFTFTLPPDHFAWGDIYVFKGNVEVYENNDLIFFGRVANVDQNWNNERVVECEGALAFFNDSIQRPNSWTSNTLISQFLSDILDNHNAQVPDDRKIYLGNVTIDDMYVTRETNYEKTLDVLTRMCIDTNGGYFSLRKDENDGKIYLDWLKDLTDIAAQPVEFGLNLLDISRSLHAEDICTGVLARGGEVNDVKIDLHEVGEIDDPSIPVIHHTNQDPDILWHRDGLEGYGRVVQVKEFNDCTTVDGDNGLLAKATEWLIKQNTDIDTIEVDAAELGYFGESYPIFLLGQKVLVNSHPHHLENVELPMYKISMNLDSGTKRISIGTPPKRELTQISASNMGGGSGSGSSSGGGSGSGGVQDVRVNGTSVVQDGIARVNVPTDTVTESEMNTAISTAVSGKANQSDLESLATTVSGKANQSDLESLATTVSGKANTSEVTAALALKADKTEIPEIEANPSDAATDTLNKIDIEGTVYQLAGGTEVVANPSEPATDDLNTIKIGNTVYDIPGGGSTNYGKFKCDVLFVNDPLPHPTQSGTANVTRNYTLSKSIDDYDAVYVIVYGYYYDNGSIVDGPNQKLSGMIFKSDYYSNNNWLFNSSALSRNQRLFLRFTDDTHVETITTRSDAYDERVLYKVYGLKFENKLINRSDIYSEEERMIGRWTDGKPLYQKTWDFGEQLTIPVNTWTTVSQITGIPFESVISSEGTQYPSNASVLFDTWYDGTNLKLMTLRNSNDYIGSLTLRYTKTTDSADSGVIPEDPMIISDSMIYSEDEQVVGSWTDGKPLYQRTYRNIRVTNNADNVVDSNFGTDKNICTHDIEFRGISGNYRSDYNTSVDDTLYSNNNGQLVYYFYKSGSWSQLFDTVDVTIQYTKTTDSILSGPKKGKIVQRSDIYSEEERLVGRWTDGKPLYQKTINFGALPNNTIKTVSSGLTNVVMHNIFGVAKAPNGFTLTLPHREISGAGNVDIVYQADNYVRLRTDYNYSSYTSYITLQYTKTTDLPFSKQLIEDPMFISDSMIYSEEEQVVGSWTDGKPIYQKTVIVSSGSLSSGSMNVPTTGITDVEKCIDWSCRLHSNSENRDFPIPYDRITYSESIQCLVHVLADHTISCTLHSGDRSSYNNIGDICITFKYTKTTDSVLSGPKKGKIVQRSDIYSEEERMIGRWTDGKPIYQKTWFNVPNGTDLVTNVDTLVDYRVKKRGTSGSEDYQDIGDGFRLEDSSVIKITNNIAAFYCWTSTQGYLNKTAEVITLQYTKTTDAPFSKQLIEDPQFVMMSDIYSEDEQVVGRWTDGKPLYQKTVDVGTIMYDSSWHTVPHNIQNVDEIMVVNGYVESSGNTKYWFSAYRPGYSIGTLVGVSSQNVEYINNWLDTSENPKLVVTVQYTKTTDAPGTGPTKGNLIYLPALYSEEEREVGVWTDGKPLYQKVVRGNFNGAYNTTVTIYYDDISSGIEVVHKLEAYAMYQYGSDTSSRAWFKNNFTKNNNINFLCSTTVAGRYISLEIMNPDWATMYDYYMIIQYTKTTDQPGSGTFLIDGTPSHNYSTSEKVVGTWVDGSTIYERTWTGLSIATNTSWHSTGIDVSFANRIIGGTSIDNAGQVITESYAHPGYNDLLARSMFIGNTIATITLQYTKSS